MRGMITEEGEDVKRIGKKVYVKWRKTWMREARAGKVGDFMERHSSSSGLKISEEEEEKEENIHEFRCQILIFQSLKRPIFNVMPIFKSHLLTVFHSIILRLKLRNQKYE